MELGEKYLQELLTRIEEAEHWRDGEYGELWQDCYRRYRSRPLPRREGSNIFVPQTFLQCEVIKSRIRESLFAQRPYISVLPVEDGDQEHAANMELLLDWQMNERMDLATVLGDTVATALVVYGTAVVYTGWAQQIRHTVTGQGGREALTDACGELIVDGKGEPVFLPHLQPLAGEWVVYDDPLAENVPLYDFFVDPQAVGIADARFCGHTEYQTREALQELERLGKYSIDWDKLEAALQEADSFAPGADKSRYLLHHYWEDNRHVVILQRQQIICDEENPFWHGMKPYDKCCYINLPGEFYGMGVPEIMAGLQDELNTARNQRIDYNSMALRRMWKLRRGCGLTAKDLVWRQNGILQVENMDDVTEINIQDIPANAFANEASIKQDMQDATGCHDILMGMSYANETATTTVTRDNNASLRFKAIISGMVRELLLPVARKCAALDQQFLSESRILRLLGENRKGEPGSRSISPYDLMGEFDLSFCGSSLEPAAGKQQNKEKALQAYSLALADPAYARDDGARLRLFRRVLEALEIRDADTLLPEAAAAEGGMALTDEQGVPIGEAAHE